MPPKQQQRKSHVSKPPSSNRQRTRTAPPAPKCAPSGEPIEDKPSLDQEQQLLNLFRRTFQHLFNSDLPQLLQKVKQLLYNRDYINAFGTEENLQAYVVRWSPSRALAYKEIFLSTCEEVRSVFDIRKRVEGSSSEDLKVMKEVVCIGGGAGAEIAGIAGAIRSFLVEAAGPEEEPLDGPIPVQDLAAHYQQLHVTAVDIASWSTVVTSLVNSFTTAPPRTPSAAPLLPPNIYSATFEQADILAPDVAPSVISKKTSLITLLFTTNELFTQSKAQATAFLRSLSSITSKGCLLLVVESAGSYSTVKIGDTSYSMTLLLDFALLGYSGDAVGERRDPPSASNNQGWELVMSQDSKWYRLPSGLKYPIDLENMRYLIRVYRRI